MKFLKPILKVLDLSHCYEQGNKNRWSLRHINFELQAGKTLGIIGESGSGKTTLAKAIVGLLKPTSGSIFFHQHNLCQKSHRQMKPFRKHIQFLFQNYDASLNPRMSIHQILSEPMDIHQHVPEKERQDRLEELLSWINLEPHTLEKYPYELSGGQRQRINLARALVMEPELLVCDEPFTALDATHQLQMIELFQRLQNKLNFSAILIGHDISVVAQLSNEMIVMHEGSIVENAPTPDICKKPEHPYTQQLISSIPQLRRSYP